LKNRVLSFPFPSPSAPSAQSADDFRRPRRQSLRRGLSRSEIVALVVIGLVGAAVLLPYLAQSQRSARRVTCSSRQADAAMTMLFASELRPGKEFPGYANELAVDAAGQPQKTGWVFSLLPYLHRQIDPKTGKTPGPDVFGPWKPLHQQHGPQGADSDRGQPPTDYIAELICPDDPRATKMPREAWLSFVANCGLPDAPPKDGFPADWPANGVFLERFLDRDERRAMTWQFIEDHDGASYTLLLSENIDAGKWTDASEAQTGFLWYPGTAQGAYDPASTVLFINMDRGQSDGTVRFARPASGHERGVNVAYADGHTSFLVDEIDYRIYAAHMSPDGQNAMWPASDKPLDPPWRETR
jgi:prepilin-type processing-associated H-X9-DG protein